MPRPNRYIQILTEVFLDKLQKELNRSISFSKI